MRTDSVRVSDSAIASVREFIGSTYDERYLPGKPNLYNPRKNARIQDAHETIRPTDVRRRPEQIQRYLEPDQLKLYQLIWQRFVASQMTPAVYDMTIVEFDLGRYIFRATGSVVLFDGYHVLYKRAEKRRRKSMDDLAPIPPLAVGDEVDVREIMPSQHFTEPPPRFLEASLVKELERLGIEAAVDVQYHHLDAVGAGLREGRGRRFFPTELGEMVAGVMVEKFPDIFNVEFTSSMESELDKVEDGGLAWRNVLKEFYGPFTKALDAVDINALVAKAHGISPEDLASQRCPKCGSPIELKTGRFGPYLACVKYKDTCDYVKSLQGRQGAGPSERQQKCHLCGSAMVIKTGRYGFEFPRLHDVPELQGHPLDSPRHQMSEVHRGRYRRAADQARQIVLGSASVTRRVTSPLGTSRFPTKVRVPLDRHGEAGQQGRRRDADLLEVREQDSRGRAGGWHVT